MCLSLRASVYLLCRYDTAYENITGLAAFSSSTDLKR